MSMACAEEQNRELQVPCTTKAGSYSETWGKKWQSDQMLPGEKRTGNIYWRPRLFANLTNTEPGYERENYGQGSLLRLPWVQTKPVAAVQNYTTANKTAPGYKSSSQ